MEEKRLDSGESRQREHGGYIWKAQTQGKSGPSRVQTTLPPPLARDGLSQLWGGPSLQVPLDGESCLISLWKSEFGAHTADYRARGET